MGGDVPFIPGRTALNVLVLSRDDSLYHDIEAVCSDRGYTTARPSRLAEVGEELAAGRPNVLLLDWAGSLEAAGVNARTITALHTGLAIVVAAVAPDRRSERGVRVVDRWRSAERLVDELELAFIGIPPSVSEAAGETA